MYALVAQLLQQPNLLPDSEYEASKLLQGFMPGYDKFEACINDCMLYHGDKAHLSHCEVCHSKEKKSFRRASLHSIIQVWLHAQSWQNTWAESGSALTDPVLSQALLVRLLVASYKVQPIHPCIENCNL